MDSKYAEGISHIAPGDEIVVLFAFHRSQRFTPDMLQQTPPRQSRPKGVFSTCSPVRPNPIGMSIVKVVSISDCTIAIEGMDMFDGTPVLDIKPHISCSTSGA